MGMPTWEAYLGQLYRMSVVLIYNKLVNISRPAPNGLEQLQEPEDK